MTQEPAPTAYVVRECHCWLTPGASVTATFLAFSASFPPTWPSIAIIPDTDVVALPGPPSPVRSKSPGAPGAAPRPSAEWEDQSQLPRPGWKKGRCFTERLSRQTCSILPDAPISPLLLLSKTLPAGPKERILLLDLLTNQEPAN